VKPEGQPSDGSPKPGGSRMQGQGSGQQGRNLVGESPIVSIDRFRHVAIPQFGRVIASPLRGVNGLAALCTHKVCIAVGAIGGSSE
jgi:hypothetical protein